MVRKSLTPYLILVVTGAAIAGCIAPDDEALENDHALTQLLLDATPDGGDHDHHGLTGHNASWNAERLAWSPGHDEPTTYGEVDAQAGLVATAILHQVDDKGPGFFLVDATEPGKLDPLGAFTDLAPSVYVADLKLSPDGNWLFLAVQNFGQIEDHLIPDLLDPPELPLDPPRWPNTIVDAGVYIFDVSDPSFPILRGFHTEQFSGVHMMYVHEIDGELYAFLQSTSAPGGMCLPEQLLCPDDTPLVDAGWRVTIAQFHDLDPMSRDRDNAGSDDGNPPWFGSVAALVPVAEYEGIEGHYIHDMSVYDDPETGRTLMYVAHWNAGITVVDVTDAPDGTIEQVGAWSPEEFLDSSLYGNVHTVMADWIGDRRIVVGSPELGYAEEVPPIYILDATDLANITELARWTIPNDGLNYTSDDPDRPVYRWSPHNFQLIDGVLYLAHFHAGVWVLDLNQDPTDPEVLAYTTLEPEGYGGGALNGLIADSPSVWDVAVHNGTIWASDINSGLYSVKLPADLGPAQDPEPEGEY